MIFQRDENGKLDPAFGNRAFVVCLFAIVDHRNCNGFVDFTAQSHSALNHMHKSASP